MTAAYLAAAQGYAEVKATPQASPCSTAIAVFTLMVTVGP
jgi:hypothetical protein